EEVLRRIIELARRWLPEYPLDISASGNARLNLSLARALQDLGDRTEDDQMLLDSELAYNQAIYGLAGSRNPGGLLTDAKSGLATVLQVRGEKAKDADMLRRAVALHRELVEISRSGGRSKEEAGPFENFAGSLSALAKLVSSEEAQLLYSESKEALARA